MTLPHLSTPFFIFFEKVFWGGDRIYEVLLAQYEVSFGMMLLRNDVN